MKQIQVEKIRVGKDLVSSTLFLVLAFIIWFSIPNQIDVYDETLVNARYMPKLITVFLFVLSVSLMIKTLRTSVRGEVLETITIDKVFFIRQFRTIAMIGILTGYAFLIGYFGFLLPSLLVTNGVLVFQKVRNIKFYAIASLITLTIYVTFKYLLKVPLP